MQQQYFSSSTLSEPTTLLVSYLHFSLKQEGVGRQLQTETSYSFLRSLFPSSNDEAISKSCVHCKDGACVGFCHQPNQKVILPDIHVSIDGTSESKIVLKETTTAICLVNAINCTLCLDLIKLVLCT